MDTSKPDYQKLYSLLFCAISDALDILPLYPDNSGPRSILLNALLTAEEIYISSADTDETKEN